MDFLSLFNHSNFTLDKVIGQGGMAIVYLGEHKVMKRPVAIKFLLPEFMSHENIRKRFLSEGRNMFSMNHENIVRVIDLIDQPDLVAIVMEYVAGHSLKKMIDDYGALEEEEIREYFPQMLKAVGYVHAQGLIHRDLKPSNFIVSADGKVKLFDFGIAKSLQVENIEHTVTGANQTLGTPLFMSPEQVKETRNVSHLTDIYSIGVVLWQMVTGKRPYGENLSSFELQLKIVSEPLALTETKWDRIILKATQKESTLRYPSCDEILQEMEEITKIRDSKTLIESKQDKQPKQVRRKEKDKSKDNDSQVNFEKSKKTGFSPIYLWGLSGFSIILSVSLFYYFFINEKNKDSLKIEDLDLNMVFVQGGTFEMGCTNEQGSECQYKEFPVHRVSISDFYMGKYEVTQAEWKEVMGSNPSFFKNCDNCPVESVNWYEIQLFLSKLKAKTGKNYRLPTEAEWEYAARGGSSSRGYKYAGSNSIVEVAWYGSNSGIKTRPVGQKKANELGLYDMSGNVFEWCEDYFGDYSASAQTNPIGSNTGFYRVIRGGSWDYYPEGCRVAYRFYDTPTNRRSYTGLRLCRTP